MSKKFKVGDKARWSDKELVRMVTSKECDDDTALEMARRVFSVVNINEDGTIHIINGEQSHNAKPNELTKVTLSKNDVINALRNMYSESGFAEIIVEISEDGNVKYKEESIIVSLKNDDNEDPFADDTFDNKNLWCVYESISDFKKNITYGIIEANEYYEGFYVTDFKCVKPFVGDFNK